MDTQSLGRSIRGTFSDPYKYLLHFFKTSSVKLVSVDIFDTLLLRTTHPEAQRFHTISGLWKSSLEKHNLPACEETLFFLRMLAHKYAYRNVLPVDGVREANYQSVISATLRGALLPPSMESNFLEIELEYEKRSMKLNSRLAKALHECRNNGKRVIAISDMYFSSNALERLLNHYIDEDLVQRIYSSSEYGVTKSSGLFFQKVQEEENVQKKDWVHCGDNYISDYLMPKDFGINAFYTPRPFLWRFVSKVRRDLYTAHKDLKSL